MDKEEVLHLINILKTQKSEQHNIEIKAAHRGCLEKFYDTVSSFANQDEGGVIIFGISENDNYDIIGVYDSNDLQKRITSLCDNMIPKIRPDISIFEIDGKNIIAVEIFPVDYELRPVYYAPRGKISGSYIRVGDADEPMTISEIYTYDVYRSHIKDDARVPDDSKWKLLNKERLQKYLLAVKSHRENLSNNVSDEDILELMGVTKNGLPTLAGIMVFSSYPQSYYPNLTINAVVVPGIEIGELGEDGERFIDNKKITGAIPDMLKLALDFVYRNQKIKTIINDMGKRVDRAEYPMSAIREALLNALVHRDYSKYSENIPITLTMYSNRIEITNPGGLFGRISIDSLGKVMPETRNGILADILELLEVTENRYSGIPTMRVEMEKNSLSDPEFKVEHGTFKTILFNSKIETNGCLSIENKIYEFCKSPKTRDEIIQMVGLSQYYVMNKIIKPMIRDGRIGLTLPATPQSKNQKFFSK